MSDQVMSNFIEIGGVLLNTDHIAAVDYRGSRAVHVSMAGGQSYSFEGAYAEALRNNPHLEPQPEAPKVVPAVAPKPAPVVAAPVAQQSK